MGHGVRAPVGYDAFLCPNDIAFVERADRILESRSAPARECALDQAVADLDALALSLKAAA